MISVSIEGNRPWFAGITLKCKNCNWTAKAGYHTTDTREALPDLKAVDDLATVITCSCQNCLAKITVAQADQKPNQRL